MLQVRLEEFFSFIVEFPEIWFVRFTNSNIVISPVTREIVSKVNVKAVTK